MNSTQHKATPAVPSDLEELALLDIKRVCSLAGLSASAIRERIREGTFPKPDVVDGMRCTRWTVGTVRRWLLDRVTAPKPAGLDEALKKRAKGAVSSRRKAAGLALVPGAGNPASNPQTLDNPTA